RLSPQLSLLILYLRRDTTLKKLAFVVAVFALAVLMVLPVVGFVNVSAGKSVTIDRTLSADGWPLPPGQPTSNATLVADGWPLPPGPPTLTSRLLSHENSLLVRMG